MIVEASGSVTGLLVPGLTRMQITVFVIMPSTSQLSHNNISLDQFIPGDPNLCSAWFIVHSMLSSNILLSTLVIGESSLTLSKPLLIGHFQLEQFISQFKMKCFASERIWSHDSD